jgi:hypothetical protein
MTTRDPKTGRFVKRNVSDSIDTLETIVNVAAGSKEDVLLKKIRDDTEQADEAFDTLEQRIKELETKEESMQWFAKSLAMDRTKSKIKLQKEQTKVEEEANKYNMLKNADLMGYSESMDIKVKEPEEFDGSSDKLKSFIRQCQLVFALKTDKFETAKSRLLYCLSYFTKGRALAWREMVLSDETTFLAKVVSRAEDSKVSPWDMIIKIIDETFSSATTKTIAQQKLYNVKQGNKTVEEFITDFAMLTNEAELDEELCLIFFKNGLKEIIRQRIYETGNIPENLKQWKERAKAIDLGWRESQVLKGNTNKEYGKARFVKPGNPNQNRPRLSDDEFQKRRNDKACFRCGNKGHFAKECKVQIRQAQVEEVKEETPEQDFP